jgi:hypothetical protein
MAVRKSKLKVPAAKPAEAAPETCFTVMPFGGWFDDYYESIYKPAIERAGLRACRADDLYRPSTIVTDIWTYTKSAKLILADLSGKNPNVFYELGLAHALAKPAILVTESMDDVPFDLRALRVLQYDKNQPRWGEQLQEKITASIKEVVASPLQAVRLSSLCAMKRSSRRLRNRRRPSSSYVMRLTSCVTRSRMFERSELARSLMRRGHAFATTWSVERLRN